MEAVMTKNKKIVDCEVQFKIPMFYDTDEKLELTRLARQAVEYRLQGSAVMQDYQIITVELVPNKKQADVVVFIAVHLDDKSDLELETEAISALSKRFECIHTLHDNQISIAGIREK